MKELTKEQEDFMLEKDREENLDECIHVHKDAPENSICEECGNPYNSEYHMSDECVNINEDIK